MRGLRAKHVMEIMCATYKQSINNQTQITNNQQIINK